jgi:hypothetical protein
VILFRVGDSFAMRASKDMDGPRMILGINRMSDYRFRARRHSSSCLRWRTPVPIDISRYEATKKASLTLLRVRDA